MMAVIQTKIFTNIDWKKKMKGSTSIKPLYY